MTPEIETSKSSDISVHLRTNNGNLKATRSSISLRQTSLSSNEAGTSENHAMTASLGSLTPSNASQIRNEVLIQESPPVNLSSSPIPHTFSPKCLATSNSNKSISLTPPALSRPINSNVKVSTQSVQMKFTSKINGETIETSNKDIISRPFITSSDDISNHSVFSENDSVSIKKDHLTKSLDQISTDNFNKTKTIHSSVPLPTSTFKTTLQSSSDISLPKPNTISNTTTKRTLNIIPKKNDNKNKQVEKNQPLKPIELPPSINNNNNNNNNKPQVQSTLPSTNPINISNNTNKNAMNSTITNYPTDLPKTSPLTSPSLHPMSPSLHPLSPPFSISMPGSPSLRPMNTTNTNDIYKNLYETAFTEKNNYKKQVERQEIELNLLKDQIAFYSRACIQLCNKPEYRIDQSESEILLSSFITKKNRNSPGWKKKMVVILSGKILMFNSKQEMYEREIRREMNDPTSNYTVIELNEKTFANPLTNDNDCCFELYVNKMIQSNRHIDIEDNDDLVSTHTSNSNNNNNNNNSNSNGMRIFPFLGKRGSGSDSDILGNNENNTNKIKLYIKEDDEENMPKEKVKENGEQKILFQCNTPAERDNFVSTIRTAKNLVVKDNPDSIARFTNRRDRNIKCISFDKLYKSCLEMTCELYTISVDYIKNLLNLEKGIDSKLDMQQVYMDSMRDRISFNNRIYETDKERLNKNNGKMKSSLKGSNSSSSDTKDSEFDNNRGEVIIRELLYDIFQVLRPFHEATISDSLIISTIIRALLISCRTQSAGDAYQGLCCLLLGKEHNINTDPIFIHNYSSQTPICIYVENRLPNNIISNNPGPYIHTAVTTEFYITSTQNKNKNLFLATVDSTAYLSLTRIESYSLSIKLSKPKDTSLPPSSS
ncbi:hypothetical protein WA158_005679 [Blastocystis sp. Blastoise]